jgi:tRNA splicing endonuclease
MRLTYLSLYEHNSTGVLSKDSSICFDITYLKYRVFKHIYSLGQGYLTSAMKFGGDFLYYPGDPLRYHASAIFHILKKMQRSTNELQAMGRLSSSVKKRQILVYEHENQIHYQLLVYRNDTWQLEPLSDLLSIL